MSDTSFDGQRITAGTSAHPASARVPVHTDPRGRPARPGVFHRPDQQLKCFYWIPSGSIGFQFSGVRFKRGHVALAHSKQ